MKLDEDRIPLRQRIFLRQLAESPESADISLLDGIPEHHRLWAMIRHAIIRQNVDELRYNFYRFLKTRARRQSGRLRAICAASDLFLLSGKLNDYAETRHIAFELIPDRVEPDDEAHETIATIAIAAGFAGDTIGVEEIEPWIYSLGVNPAFAVLAQSLLERPNKRIEALFEQVIENEEDKYKRTKYQHIVPLVTRQPLSGYRWGPLFRVKKEGWYTTIVSDDDFVFFKPSRLFKLSN